MSKELDDNTPGEESDAIHYKKIAKMMSDGNKNNNMRSELFAQKINKQGIIGKMQILFTRNSNGKKNKIINVPALAGSRRNKTNRRRRKITHRRNKRHGKSTRRRRHRKH
jgi:hypothetical protein